jgi:hypothetical protein
MRFAGFKIEVRITLFVHIITLSLAAASIRIALYLSDKSSADRYRLHGYRDAVNFVGDPGCHRSYVSGAFDLKRQPDHKIALIPDYPYRDI